MKLKRWSQGILVVTTSVGIGAGLISCGQSNTVDYLYATSAKNDPGQINIYRVDSQSGALTQIPDSPFPTQQRNPVSLAADGQGKNLYVAFADDNAIVQYGIGSDAKLYPQNTINPSGTNPVSVSVQTYLDPTGKVLSSLLFVVEQYQPNYTSLNPGPGALYVYNLGADGTLNNAALVPQTVNGVTQNYYPLGINPTAVNVTANGRAGVVVVPSGGKVHPNIYVADTLTQSGTGPGGCSAGTGGVESFTLSADDTNGAPTGVVTPVIGTPFCAGTTPSAMASDPLGRFLYVTDSTQNEVYQYNIDSATSTTPGALLPLPTSAVQAGTSPQGIVVDPRGEYVYVSNYIGDTVSGYAINTNTGALSALGTGGSVGTEPRPSCIIVEPALARFVYTADYDGNAVNGFVLNPDTGGLSAVQGQYYQTSGLSKCVAAVSHGNHPVIQDYASAGS
jgi:6-phosphogluconolactonase